MVLVWVAPAGKEPRNLVLVTPMLRSTWYHSILITPHCALFNLLCFKDGLILCSGWRGTPLDWRSRTKVMGLLSEDFMVPMIGKYDWDQLSIFDCVTFGRTVCHGAVLSGPTAALSDRIHGCSLTSGFYTP